MLKAREIRVVVDDNMAAANGSCVGTKRNGKNSGKVESWRLKCVKKWNLKLAPNNDTNETEWKKYYAERKEVERS